MDDAHRNRTAEWPTEDLETLGACPACGNPAREVMIADVEDYAFRVAPGRWTFWRCQACYAAYLDPRPTEASIGRAYSSYYTHDTLDERRARNPLAVRDTAARVRSGYYQAEYGHRLDGVPLLGALAARLNPAKRIAWDHLIRHLPPPSHPGAPLLDVGCGSGRFLDIAASLGYAASGFDPDPIAAQLATSRGLDVRVAQLPDTGLPSGHFEQITLSHVFEHVHSPTRAAAEILRLLQPGGRVWFCQPNLQSLGLAHFGKYWRGLEAPRHLCLFDAEGLRDFLAQNGFCDIRRLPGRSEAVESFQASLTMQEHQIPKTGHVPVGWNSTWAESAAQSNKATARAPERAENLTMSARKPLD